LLDRLTEFDATFTDRDARAVALEASAGATIDQSLRALDQLRATNQVLELSDGRHTTRAHRRAEQQTARAAQQLAAAGVAPIPGERVERSTERLARELAAAGGELSAEQRRAIELGCSEKQLVVVEGQAGTGKSTILAAIARAQQADGREIIVTSTAALAAQRLAGELADAGVNASSFSTAALHAALAKGEVTLGRETTVIHDEAALASTREQRRLLDAIETSGARLIAVGDPRQSQAVGAGGLWSHIEHAARSSQAHVELTRNLRARDPDDRRDQRRFREHHHEQALRGYHDRGRLILSTDQRHAEDNALEAAQADGCAGKRTIVIAQTSNEQLDELNARAQAIRIEHGELETPGVPITGKPYAVHTGDHVQIRRTIHHPRHSQLRNGTTADVVDVDLEARLVTLRLADGREVQLERPQIERADIRLAYVQHPFPAQGRTTDTAHLIVADHATEEGSYVAITRARQATYIHASDEHLGQDHDPLSALAERMSRSEPEVPSIHTPLAHETELRDLHDLELSDGNEAAPDSTRPGAIAALDRGEADRHPVTGRPAAPSRYLLAGLGARPTATDPNLHVWERAADAIERYRLAYDIDPNEPAVLGPQPPAGELEQHDHRAIATSLVREARATLNLEHEQTPAAERTVDLPALADHDPAWGPTIEWEP
jgi:ATP-dependent exoDNAse (exonuclease V) alpha subunit